MKVDGRCYCGFLTYVAEIDAEARLTTEIAPQAAQVVAETYDRSPGLFPIERAPRMWLRLRRN